tara:strand:+ start:871 stop:1797 length:927 start_codon:yes stop_codon:yes gene_type:complete
MKNELTIFITTYERPNYLIECLNNLNNQTFKNFKVIILDNSKKDNYSRVVNNNFNFKLNYKKNKNNIGSVKNIFQAFLWNIDTPYFMIFHDDDLMHKDYIKYCINKMNSDSEICWIGCNSSKKKLKNNNIKKIKEKIVNKKELILAIFSGINFTYSSIIYNKNNINKLNIDKYYHEYSIIHDRPLIIDFIKDYMKVCIISNKFIFYRVHEKQDSKSGILNLTIENQFNLYLFYKKNMERNLNNFIRYNLFISNNIISDFYKLNNINKVTLSSYIIRAKNKNIVNNFFPFFFIIGKLYYIIKKILRLLD